MLELGSYVAPAYAGMILGEQGFYVEKWFSQSDPILGLNHGDELWHWINHRKRLIAKHSHHVNELEPGAFDIVIDNHRLAAWRKWGIDDLDALAKHLQVVWVSLRADDDNRSFDVIAQARAWGDLGVLPFYIGDTAAGLWVAFKALSAPGYGHYIVRQAAALAKLVEGEAVVERAQWDSPGTYYYDADNRRAVVVYRDEVITEPVRDTEWRRAHLANDRGRFIV